MFQETHIPETAVATADTSPAPEPQTPTMTFYQQLADDCMKQLDAMAAAVPGLEEQHPSTAKFVQGHQSIPNAFIVSALAAMEQTPSLHGINGLDPITSRSDLQFIDAFTQVVDKLMAFRNALLFTIRSKKASLASDALQTYYLTKGVARNRTNAAAVSHVANMKRDLGKRGRRPAQPKQQPEPTPQTPASQTPQAPEPHGNAAQA